MLIYSYNLGINYNSLCEKERRNNNRITQNLLLLLFGCDSRAEVYQTCYTYSYSKGCHKQIYLTRKTNKWFLKKKGLKILLTYFQNYEFSFPKSIYEVLAELKLRFALTHFMRLGCWLLVGWSVFSKNFRTLLHVFISLT